MGHEAKNIVMLTMKFLPYIILCIIVSNKVFPRSKDLLFCAPFKRQIYSLYVNHLMFLYKYKKLHSNYQQIALANLKHK